MKLNRTFLLALMCLAVLPSCARGSASPVEEPPRPDTLSIYIVGDIMSHGKQMLSAHNEYLKTHPDARRDDPNAYDWSCFFAPIADRIGGSDLAVGNVEFPFAGPPYNGYPSFSAPESYLDYLCDVGFDVMLAANNHILDKGKAGIERSLEDYRKMEAEGRAHFTGISGNEEEDAAHYPLTLETRGVRIAFINCTYGTNEAVAGRWPKVNRIHSDPAEILEAIATARERDSADIVIALPHWGVEYDRLHNKAQATLADRMIEAGADAIVGSHPHRVQDMELRRVTSDTDTLGRLVPVFYSLGNAVSNQNDLEGRLELAVTLLIERSPDGSVRMLEPCWEYLWCTKAGMILDSYAVIPVTEYIDRPDAWKSVPEDYDKMVKTHATVKKTTRIDDWKPRYEENDPAGSH